MNELIINIAKDFSRIPGARKPEEGNFSGQEFREKILFPKMQSAITSNVTLTVILDGTAGLGTSFLEESFGGLIRINKLSYDDIKAHLNIVSKEDEEYLEEVEDYLFAAYEQSRN